MCCEVFTHEPPENESPTNPLGTYQLSSITFEEEDVSRALARLNPNKGSGPDSIHPRVLREAREVLAPVPTMFFNMTLAHGQVPTEWKVGHTTTVYEKGSKAEPANYRPITLTSVVCKMLERLIKTHIMRHLLTNNLLSDAQYGFRPRRSCTLQMLCALDEWSHELDTGESLDVAYLDFSKAFDVVPYQ